MTKKEAFIKIIQTEIFDRMDIYAEKDILAHVKEVSAYLEEKLDKLVKNYDFVTEKF